MKSTGLCVGAKTDRMTLNFWIQLAGLGRLLLNTSRGNRLRWTKVPAFRGVGDSKGSFTPAN